MNNYKEFNQSFSNLEPIYVYDEDSKSVIDSGELRDCQAEIDSHIDECSSLFINDFLAEELSAPSVDFDDDTIVNVVPRRPSDLDNYLRESELYSVVASNLGLDISNMSFQQLKNAVFDSIIKKNNKENSDNEKKNEQKDVKTSVSPYGDENPS